ncbi:MAG: PorV/PorQ family protein [Nitrospirota bacterium]|nr:PorV/PorQ family protein [Nitrospirota bacterium]
MKKILLIVLVVMINVSRIPASDPGSTGANFLKINLAPRELAMGSVGIGLADGPGAMFTNPAGLGSIGYQSLSFFYNIWLEGMSAQYLSYIIPTGIGNFGATANYFAYGKIQGYDASGTETSNIDAYDLCFLLSYGRSEILKGVSGGLNFKVLHEKLEKEKAMAFGGDVGIKIDLGKSYNILKGVSLGCSVKNIGTGLKFDKEKAPLPLSYGVGIGVKRELLGEELNLGVDMNIPNDNSMYVGTGLEYWIKDIIAVRAGYNSKKDSSNGLSLGIGIKADIFSMNYAFVDYGELGYTHRMGMDIKFGRHIKEVLIRKAFERGVSYMRKKKYAEAILEFNKVLKYDSSNIGALELIKEANEKMAK